MLPHIVEAFMQQGWSRQRAEEYVQTRAGPFIRDELEGLEQEYHRSQALIQRRPLAPLS